MAGLFYKLGVLFVGDGVFGDGDAFRAIPDRQKIVCMAAGENGKDHEKGGDSLDKAFVHIVSFLECLGGQAAGSV